jgi:hypothetical protein
VRIPVATFAIFGDAPGHDRVQRAGMTVPMSVGGMYVFALWVCRSAGHAAPINATR